MDAKPTLVILMGIQGSGKSMFFHQHLSGMIHVNLDTLHTRHREEELISDCLLNRRSFAVDNTNPTKADRERYILAAKVHDFYILKILMFTANGYQSADAAAMFRHGGDPSILMGEESLIRELHWELQFFLCGDMEFRYLSDAVVHYWMVFIGYGAKLEDGREIVKPVDGFDITKFRNHRQYYYGQIHSDRSNDGMEVCFFDKDTNREVARY